MSARQFFEDMDQGNPNSDRRWLFCESARVVDVDDPDRQGRIQAIIPIIDEDLVWGDWIRPLSQVALGDGFGLVLIPKIGDEVLITGALGEKHNLFYHGGSFNDDVRIPAELDADTPGIKVEKNLSFLVGLLLKAAGQNIQIVAEQLASITGENVDAIAGSLARLHGQNATIEADQAVAVMGNTVTLHADGSITIQAAGGNVSISASGNASVTATGILTLQGRVVNKFGLPI